jgi:hypothetical protein
MNDGSDEIRAEDIAASKRKARVNALTLGLVFLLGAFAPYRWKAYAPLLFLMPVLYRLYTRIRKSAGSSEIPVQAPAQIVEGEPEEPYSYTPRDPKDPRRYKPIG